ncbi:sulfotransferase family protein [Paracoccus tegillarcae]|uniref:Sulfotransferase family protein n=1 Tax=Paracoccus tegillarcae TaxID=1529068 RepID=A0A2K9ENX5_9RHOB|nr:sulfotransferase family protein [Paracoccus tegillarcae]AUH35177.1 sulfotransferase family protein [Paracoccus tegillarcae]
MRIAMWSGPRNLSTAMMRSFGARGDCACVDEPFYAHYLLQTGLDHPMRDQIIASQPHDWRAVRDALMAPVGQPIQYQKHMVQHMLPEVETDWLNGLVNVFLIREPERVVASFSAKRGAPSPAELGFCRQRELFQQLRTRGREPVVIDSADIRRAPEVALRALCKAAGIDFTERMLAWEPGAKPEDGVWGAHWYDAVNASTGFAGPEAELPVLEGKLANLAQSLQADYQAVAAHKLVID